jgi:predicted TIM-barrel fold metal-dependent hydrolase
MDDAREHAERLLGRVRASLGTLLPADAVLADAHTHLGVDEDGMAMDLETLLGGMAEFGVTRALVFPLHEADRHPAYRAPNDRVLDWAARSGGRLVPLARLDLAEDPINEARRCLARGARGIKLHPRAQAFAVDDRRLEPVFELAEAERLPVLIHAGRGMPPIGADLARVAERHPGAILILAHAAIVDQERICRLMQGLPNVFFDTSTWNVVDIVNLLSLVAPEQVLWATDLPYGNHLTSLMVIAAVLDELGATEQVRRGVLGETLEGIVRGELPTLSDPIAPSQWTLPHARQRVYTYLAAATPMLWTGHRDVIGVTGLALGATLDAGGELAPVGELIEAGTRVWEAQGSEFTRSDVMAVYRLFQLAQVACFAPVAAGRSYLCS